MSGAVLGLDTSNYTTSAACCDLAADELRQEKRLLPVAAGEKGLRQSDAVFHHVRQLPELLERLNCRRPVAVAASTAPREEAGSYMPCFLVGEGTGRSLAATLDVPFYAFSHQQGHVAAALYGAGRLDLLARECLAFHVSGGTTEALLVRPAADAVIHCTRVAQSRDLKAGQLIDRTGLLLGLPFPAGPALEELALQAAGTYQPRAAMEGADCHLSGVENQCRQLWESGQPREEVAAFCLASVQVALAAMTEALLQRYGPLPVVYAGGVMSNSLLRRALGDRFGGVFAPPVYAADNAAGIALLGAITMDQDFVPE